VPKHFHKWPGPVKRIGGENTEKKEKGGIERREGGENKKG
tara:strand:+ start:825 stop:944 length:120 start_codon:yes stop_codon:yes gene_type:complete